MNLRYIGEFNSRYDLMQENGRNFNYVLVDKVERVGRKQRCPKAAKSRSEQRRAHAIYRINDGVTWTAFTKDDSCGRGEFAEELDITVPLRSRAAHVKRIASRILELEFDAGLRVSKVVKRFGMF